MAKTAKTEIANKIGIKVGTLNDKDITKLTELMAKTKKPVEFMIAFDGTWFSHYTRVGTNKSSITEVHIGEYPGLNKKKIIDALISYGAATKAQADAFHKKYP
ncbi:MAG: hypothetical protein AB7Q97_26740 [Gammaproteobacteria bacterium]